MTKFADCQKTDAALKVLEHTMTERAKMKFDLDELHRRTEELRADAIADAKQVALFVELGGRAALIEPQIARIGPLIEKAAQQVREALKAETAPFNRKVKTARDAKFDELVELLRPFFDGAPAKRLHRAVHDLHAPALDKIARLTFDGGFSPNPNPDFWSTQARCFISTVRRAASALGWK